MPRCDGLLLSAHHKLWRICSLLYCVHQMSEIMPVSIIRFPWFWWNFNRKTKKLHKSHYCLTNYDVCPGFFECAGSRVLGGSELGLPAILTPEIWWCAVCQAGQISGNHARSERFFLVSNYWNCFHWLILFSSLFRNHRFPAVVISCIQANSSYIQYLSLWEHSSIRLNPSDRYVR